MVVVVGVMVVGVPVGVVNLFRHNTATAQAAMHEQQQQAAVHCMCCSACVAVDKQQQQAVVHEQQCMDNTLYVCSNASLFQQSAAWLS
ncbi:hypothetical protein QJQ45_014193 [Haematococcus lacustris]|nr:hypothetical protein QJQ45_014193 [Haematococcus lacustris]